MKKVFILILTLPTFLMLGATPPKKLEVKKAAPKPNIVLIMADDMGYSDLGCYGVFVANGRIYTSKQQAL